MLLLLIGLPGTGKSTLAKAYTAKYGGLHLNSDLVRTDLGLLGHYASADKARVYAELLLRAREHLLNGHTVVLDSTLYRVDLRKPYLELAAECQAPLVLVELRADPAIVLERVSQARPASEAGPEVYEKIRADWEPVEEPHLILQTDQSTLEALVQQVHDYCLAHDH
jgi:predicted kinase